MRAILPVVQCTVQYTVMYQKPPVIYQYLSIFAALIGQPRCHTFERDLCEKIPQNFWCWVNGLPVIERFYERKSPFNRSSTTFMPYLGQIPRPILLSLRRTTLGQGEKTEDPELGLERLISPVPRSPATPSPAHPPQPLRPGLPASRAPIPRASMSHPSCACPRASGSALPLGNSPRATGLTPVDTGQLCPMLRCDLTVLQISG